MTNISLLEEENRYYNWYMGYTWIYLPYWGIASSTDFSAGCHSDTCYYNILRYYLYTYATSGSVTMKHFGETFEAGKIEKDFRYSFYFVPPREHQHNESIVLQFDIEKNLLKGYENFQDREWPAGINDDDLITNRDFKPPGSEQYFILERRISVDHLDKIEMPVMPGVRINWFYSDPNWNHIDNLVPDWHLDSSSLLSYKTFVR